MGVYGNLLREFPELKRRIRVWTAPDRTDERHIVGIYIPTQGDLLKRWKLNNRGSAINYSDCDQLFADIRQNVKVGDFFYDPDSDACDVHRIMGEIDFGFHGNFKIFRTERVTGATVDQTEELPVKEPSFA